MAAYRRVYDSRHLQADCQEPGSTPEPYALNRVWATFTFLSKRVSHRCDVTAGVTTASTSCWLFSRQILVRRRASAPTCAYRRWWVPVTRPRCCLSVAASRTWSPTIVTTTPRTPPAPLRPRPLDLLSLDFRLTSASYQVHLVISSSLDLFVPDDN